MVEGLSCSVDVLYGCIVISNLQILIQKNITAYYSFLFLVSKTPEPDQHWPKMLDSDPHWNQCESGSTTTAVNWLIRAFQKLQTIAHAQNVLLIVSATTRNLKLHKIAHAQNVLCSFPLQQETARFLASLKLHKIDEIAHALCSILAYQKLQSFCMRKMYCLFLLP